jgi:hypothetical protein
MDDSTTKQVRVPPLKQTRTASHWTEEVSKLVEVADHAAALEIERELSTLLKRTKKRIKKFAAEKQAIGLAYAGEDAVKCECGNRFDPDEEEYGGECELCDDEDKGISCVECNTKCECYHWVCLGHSAECASCDKSYCDDCIRTCEQCENPTCDDCFVTCGYGGHQQCESCQKSMIR